MVLFFSGIFLALASFLLAFASKSYIDWVGLLDRNGIRYIVRAEYPSMFGAVKVVERVSKNGNRDLIYFQDGINQGVTTIEGHSLSLFIPALANLARAFAPGKNVLVLGLATGGVPANLLMDGHSITVVEINPRAAEAAIGHFRFDPSAVDLVVADARGYVRRGCPSPFDAVVIDLFHGDVTPEYLLTREFFRDVRSCLSEGGVVVGNFFFDPVDESANERILATIAAELPAMYEFRLPSSANALVVASIRSNISGSASVAATGVLPGLRERYVALIESGTRVPLARLGGYEPNTDEMNVLTAHLAPTALRLRRAMIRHYPPGLLVN